METMSIPSTLADQGLSTFEVSTECGSTVRGYGRGLTVSNQGSGGNTGKPILVLLHGYPQTWRHVRLSAPSLFETLDPAHKQVIKLLPNDTPLFVPDIPGYGASSPSKTAHDKSTIGRAILSALSTTTPSTTPQPIVLIGHDRGARISHRLAVDAAEYASTFPLLGTVLMDIVPTVVQWGGMTRSTEAAGFFHWPFLANVELACAMIAAYGGDKFVRDMFARWTSMHHRPGIERLKADGALEIYAHAFSLESVTRAACLDYQAGAQVDVEMQKGDQENGRKVGVPVLVLHCPGIGKRFDMRGSWRDWIETGKGEKELLSVVELEGEVGHFVAEEDPEGTVKALKVWLGTWGIEF
ncbi:hypothetical protein AJ80_08731 [Polytolypa hystricis UAMH7299]|uniref:AB hydrolase-1 domain-containing protein n=1 Tax=Polytolypa hystricis (strain UAMH7299) TaxID=1447883 RepID=A0A2B7X265_POLH7|nr:hypothetical protein AJ80_08731 [Polytolypa hystricis UAMH7299]